MLVRSKSIWVTDMKPIVSTMSCTLAIIAPKRKLPFKAKPEVNQDCENREHQSDDAVGQKFTRHARPDHLDAPIIDLGTERAANFGDRLLLRCFSARLFGDPDQHVVRRTELLQLHFAETQRSERSAHFRKIGRRRLRLDLDQRAAFEVDAEIQSVKEIKRYRDDRQQRRHRKTDAPKAHEVEFGVVGNDAKQAHGRGS